MARAFDIRPLRDDERDWARELVRERWGGETMVTRGAVYEPAELDAFVAVDEDGECIGLVTYRIDGDECEICSLDSLVEGMGIGTALVEAVGVRAHRAGCRRVVVVTTNGNVRVQRLYGRLGFRVAAVRPGAVNEARKLKPAIPLVGQDGVPINDEIELERPP